MEQPDPAPALTRGLQLLRLLEREGDCSLEQLAHLSAWPKTSVLRLLTSLDGFGATVRDPASRRWRARLRLVALADDEQDLRDCCAGELSQLAELVDAAVELFVPRASRLVMLDRAEAERSRVVVRMRIGDIRNLDELEALAQVALAFGDLQPPDRHWQWHGGKAAHLTRAKAKAEIARVRRTGLGLDAEPNSFGIQRHAAPLCDQDGRLRGVLAIARAGAIQQLSSDVDDALLAAAQRIQTRLGQSQTPQSTAPTSEIPR